MNKMQVLNSFWNGFDLKAYDETSVPDGAILPYITYEAASDFFGNEVPLSASLWYRSSSWAEITEKEQQIAEFITRGGRMLACDGGVIWIKRATPWAQRLDDPSDEMIRRIALNVTVEFLT